MSNHSLLFGRKGRIALVIILAAASLLFICGIDGLFTDQSAEEILPQVASFTENASIIEGDEPVQTVNESMDAPLVRSISFEGDEIINCSVPVNDTLEIDAAIMVSCRCRNCKTDDGKKKLYVFNSTTTTTPAGNTSTTTTLNDSVTTTTSATTTSLPVDSTTTTTVPFSGTTTTTAPVTTTTLSESTTTTTSSTTTTTIPSAGEFSSGWLALAILFFAPAFTYLAVKRT